MPGALNSLRPTGAVPRCCRRMPMAVAMSLILLLVGCATGGSQRTGPGGADGKSAAGTQCTQN